MPTRNRLTLDTDGWKRAGRHLRAAHRDRIPAPAALAANPAKVYTSDAIIADRLHGPGFAITDLTIDSHVHNQPRQIRRG